MLNIDLLQEIVNQEILVNHGSFSCYCKSIDMPMETLRDILNGRKKNTRILTAIKLSQKLNIAIDDLVL